MENTINVHARFTGEVATTLDEIIRRGRAASRTEAIRLTILDYREHHLDEEDETISRLTMHANRDIWEDEKEDVIWAKYLKVKSK